MTIVILSVLAAALSLFASGLAWSHARRVARVTSGETRALATALKRVAEESRVVELERCARAGSFEHAIAASLLEAPDDAAKISTVNDALLDVEHTLRQGAGWPRAGIRIALSSGVSLGLTAWLATGDIRAAAILVAVGGASALLCVEAGRSAARRSGAQRADIDALITLLTGSLSDQAPPQGARRGVQGTRSSRRRRSS